MVEKEMLDEAEWYKIDISYQLDRGIRDILSSDECDRLIESIIEAIKKVGQDKNVPTPILKQYAYEKLCNFMRELIENDKIKWQP